MCSLLYGLYEGLFDRIYKVPAVSAPNYREIAQSILDKEKPDAAIIVPEVEVLYWAEHPFEIPHIVPPADFAQVAISKESVFEALSPYGLVPRNFTVDAQDLLSDNFQSPLPFPVWIRDGAPGTASAKGAYKAEGYQDLKAWVNLNPGIPKFQISEFLPGGNFGCFCLFKDGKLIKLAQAERIDYIMAKVAVSGITGNTSKGRLLNDSRITEVALKAIDIICSKTDSRMNGLVVVDLKADADGNPKVTEINIRHVAFSSSFAMAGINISEAQLLLALNRDKEIPGEVEMQYPEGNLILRDVDGAPIYIASHKELEYGQCTD